MSDKILKLSQAQTLYQDLRERINALPTDSDIPDVPVQDVQIDGTSILNNGVANVPLGGLNTFGAVSYENQFGNNGIIISNGAVRVNAASSDQIKQSVNGYRPIVPTTQNRSVFYGLAKASGDTSQASSNNAVGTYTDTAKQKIQNMLGITDLISTEETTTATAAHALNSTFMMNGKLHRATAAIAIGDAVEVGTNCEVVKADEVFVKNTDYADAGKPGIVQLYNVYGITKSGGYPTTLQIAPATSADIKKGNVQYKPIISQTQHESVFYGLSKIAGVDLKDETITLGTYPETSKTAIRTMIGAISNTDYATSSVAGVAKVNTNYGVQMTRVDSSSPYEMLATQMASAAELKAGTNYYKPAVPANIHQATFYGLAKAAGDTTMASSSNAVGTYTDEAKAAIHTMLGIDPASIAAQVDIPLVETVSGTTPTITGQPNVRYVCGEVSTITITPPASGSVDVIFESGSTATTMTVPSTVKWPAWFDAEALEANTTYEVLITDGIYGSVMTWAT